ncbi:MAG: hypothetical protein ACJAZW_003138 [Maritalea sp.]|jgi:hypothetical protein
MKAGAVVSYDPGGLLPAMLQSVKTKCGQCRSIIMLEDAEYTALLMQRVTFKAKNVMFAVVVNRV